MSNPGPASTQQTNTLPLLGVRLTRSEFANPSAAVLANTSVIYQQDGVDGFWQSNGASLVSYVGVPSLVSGAGVSLLSAASAGQDSGWLTYYPGMRLAYALDSGSATTTFSVDISADGSTSLGQAFSGTWASTTAEISPPIWLTNPAARYIRFNVLSGGPLSVIKF